MDSTVVAPSKKLSNGNSSSFAAYESPSKKRFGGSRAGEEDYGEIFGGSGASIPFLDVPELSESKVSVDVRSSKLDYSTIFGGGFADSSYSVCHDELLSLEPNSRKKFEEERTPAERSPPSQASETSSSAEGSHDLLSPESSDQVINGAKKFNMSYNKVSNGNANGKSGTNGTTHIAQLNAVQGYVHLIDEVASPIHRTGEGVKPVISVAQENKSSPKGNISRGGIEEAGNSVRASVGALAGEMRKQTRGSGGVEAQIQNTADWFKSYSMGKTVNRNEVGNGTHCPKVPSSSFSLPRNFNLGNNYEKTGGDEGSTSGYSPPHFEEEVDTNSVAAASAAALRKAIDDAQARIKVAKEIMERKKAGQRNGTKSFNHRLKPEESKEDKVANGVNLSKKKTALEGVDITFRALSGISEKNTAMQTPCKEIPRHTIRGETPSKEIPGQPWEEAEVSEAEQFYDAENTNENWSPTVEVDISQDSVVRRGKNVVVLARETEDCEVKKIVADGKASDNEVPCHKLKPTEAEHMHEKTEPANAAEDGVNKSADKLIQKERKRWNKPNQTVELGRSQSVDKTAQIDMKRTSEVSDHPQPCGEGPKLADGGDTQEEILRRIKLLNGSVGASDSESESEKDRSNLMLDVKVLNQEKNESEQFVTLKLGGYLEAEQEVYETESSERSSVEYGKALEMMGMEDMKHMERELVTREFPESEARGEEYGKQEEQKDQNDAHGWEENKEILISHKFQLGKEIAKMLSHDDETEATEKTFGESASWKEENENIEESSGAQVATRTNAGSNIVEGDEDEVKPAVEGEIKEVPVEEPENQGFDIGADRMSNKDETDNHSETQEPVLQSQSDEIFEASEEVLVCEGGGETFKKPSEAFLESDDSMKVKEAMEEKNVLQMDHFPIGSELIKMMKPVEDKIESVPVKENDTTDEGRIDSSFVQDPKDEPSSQMEMADDSREYSEEMVSEVANVDENIKESDASVNLEDGENNVDYFEGQECVDDGTLVKDRQSPGICEGAENVEHEEETSTSTSEEKDHERCKEIPITQKTDVNDSHQETHLSQSADTNDESRIETPMSQKAEVNEPLKETLLSQSAGTNENDRVAAPVKEKTHNESLQKEAKVEKEHQRRVDATKERDREIEKGRMAVERAVREARERALAEARERAASEKAATAARRRGAGEAPEKVGKTSGEVGAKHIAEKSSREAKLKAERAAVERATAEARARAFEKAMSSKAASDARKQNLEPKGNTSSRYPSSNHEVSNSTDTTDKSNGANGESAQRCKARSERHQRISERAEKALAEKNRRDLLVQREQAERNRLAETLDIEVKRWSSGKEGNLRALLSTLQYILGPDSGWQPIPLTEIIKTAAVKKAYRKATLSVHPDKLQQRGANIQQKYTCEKVFDLLKEAWNKFNVEER